MPRVVAVGTAVPPFCLEQQDIRELARQHFQEKLDCTKSLIGVFDNVHVHRRFFCVPLEWFERHHSFSEKNEEYIRWSERLSIEAIERCLEKADLGPRMWIIWSLYPPAGCPHPALMPASSTGWDLALTRKGRLFSVSAVPEELPG